MDMEEERDLRDVLTALGAGHGFHQSLALSALGGDDLAAVFVAGFLEVLVLAELFRQTFFFARLLETSQQLFHVFAGTAFDSYHKHHSFVHEPENRAPERSSALRVTKCTGEGDAAQRENCGYRSC